MQVHFSGIYHRSTSNPPTSSQEKGQVMSELDRTYGNMDHLEIVSPAEDEAFVLTGADTHEFYRRQGVVFPDALKGKDGIEAVHHASEPEVRTYIEEAQKVVPDTFTTLMKVKDYYNARKEAGSDIEGNPIRELGH